jgi:hypothetical protein
MRIPCFEGLPYDLASMELVGDLPGVEKGGSFNVNSVGMGIDTTGFDNFVDRPEVKMPVVRSL